MRYLGPLGPDEAPLVRVYHCYCLAGNVASADSEGFSVRSIGGATATEAEPRRRRRGGRRRSRRPSNGVAT